MAFNTNQQIVIDLFIAIYGRTVTQNGLDFFENRLDTKEMSASSIASFMMNPQNNAEAEIRYPSNLTTSDKVNIVFNNILGRDVASKEGLDFWANRIDNNPDYKMVNLISEVLQSAKNQNGNDAKTIANKSSIAEYFLEKMPQELQGSKTINLHNVIDTKSMETAKEEIDIKSNSSIDNSHQEEDKSNINRTYGELSNHDTEGVSVVDSGTHWDKNLTEISFSFNQDIPAQYNHDTGLTDDWQSLNSSQKDATREIMEELNKIIKVQLVEVPNEEGMIRLNIVNMPEGVAGFAYYPEADIGGDMFLSDEFNNRDSEYDFGLNQGENGFSTIAHELGHALGLQHPFDSPLVDTITDDTNHSIMSYSSINDKSANFSINGSRILIGTENISPNLYSLYDVSALQAIYGANTDTATEDNIYKMSYTDYEIKTIWDAGGRDKIDLSSTKGNSTIDLHGGTINSADQYSTNQIITMHQQSINKSSANDWIKAQILELAKDNHLYTGEGNLSIAQGVIIEDISTGSGDDKIRDNEVNNIILTGRGDDTIYIGAGGKDYVDGGAGNDFLYLDMLSNEVNIEKNDDNSYLLLSENFSVEFKNIEQLHFNDDSVYTPDLLIL